ncbi:FAD-binding oxidoreductase [Aspergillus affinis]|uniref:FAD-binding oxidoreductase n=1 Tax=Aspergillus affinis TaxID=1070780 RepID=UPI0022FEAE05|nr:oxidoreductase [Aspergillus affinis]KAI9035060.1 oxidoreductase [Aspergillus affinis]
MTSNSSLGTCHPQCLALTSILGSSKVFLPGTTPYQSSQQSYFAQQNTDLHPLCVVFPDSAEDVSSVITSLVATAAFLPEDQQDGCHFAIRSGGHNFFGGASNIQHGVTIDLRALSNIRVQNPPENDASHTVYIGAGATWGDVYGQLDPAGLAVAGGRAAQIGVGGLTLGGGISYFSPRYGWTCDNVVGAEVVLANGTILHLNEVQHLGELAALRGGGSKFGVVTGFDLRAFPQGPIYGGSVRHTIDTVDAQMRAFVELSDPVAQRHYDENTSLITSFAFAGGQGSAVVNSIVYTGELKDEEDHPPMYDAFFEIPYISSTVRIAPLHDVAIEQGSFSPNGQRQLSVVTTHNPTVPMLNATYIRWNASLAAVQEVPGIVWSISLEPLPPAIYARAPDSNAMGLSNYEGSLVVTVLSATWDDTADDTLVEEAARTLFAGIEADAHALEAYHPFVYLNYAAQWQNPIASYGPKSVEMLRRVSRELDPTGVFRQMMPGGFNLPT